VHQSLSSVARTELTNAHGVQEAHNHLQREDPGVGVGRHGHRGRPGGDSTAGGGQGADMGAIVAIVAVPVQSQEWFESVTWFEAEAVPSLVGLQVCTAVKSWAGGIYGRSQARPAAASPGQTGRGRVEPPCEGAVLGSIQGRPLDTSCSPPPDIAREEDAAELLARPQRGRVHGTRASCTQQVLGKEEGRDAAVTPTWRVPTEHLLRRRCVRARCGSLLFIHCQASDCPAGIGFLLAACPSS